MGPVAAVAAAITAACAAAAAGGVTVVDTHFPSWLYALALVPGIVGTTLRGADWRRPRGKVHDTVFSLVLIAGGVLIVSGFSGRGASVSTAPAAAVAVILLSLYWPDPLALGLSIVSSFVYLVTSPGDTTWAVAAVAAGAFAAVVIARLYRSQLPTFGTARSSGRQTARDGAIVLVIAAIFGALLAIVAPSPPPSQARSDAAGEGPPTLTPLGLAPGLNLAEAREQADDQIVLRVAAPEPDVWRAGTYETWTGRSWRFSDVAVADANPGGSEDLHVPARAGEVVDPASKLIQRITVETDFGRVVVGAPVPTRVVVPRGSYVISYAGVLVEGPAMARHSFYTVESSRVTANAETLRQSDPLGAPLPSDLNGYAAPPPTDVRVEALARQLTSAAPSSYDKTVAVEQWLAENTRLKRADTAVPRGRDVVSQFLFVDRGGRIERMATAMVVMLRTLGIPARLGVGFRPGERSGARGPFTVRASDASAWAEVWFPGSGWQRFDPTASLAPRDADNRESIWARLWSLARQLLPVLVVAVLAIAVWLLTLRRRARERLEAIPWATRFYGRLTHAGGKRRRPLHPHETPVEYTTALAASALPDPRLVELGELVTAAAYSGREPSPEQRQWAETVLDEATAAAPPPKR
jgi:transglutaminase-like putative cysteine protease